MQSDKLTEFVTVLVYASAIGLGVWLSISRLEGTARAVALFILAAAAIVAWQYLRRQFGRR